MVVILLASNASSDIYESINEANHFYNELPQTLDFEGKWTVALKEITYSTNVPTIIDEHIIIKKKNTEKKELIKFPIHRFYFKKGTSIEGAFGLDENDMFSFNYETHMSNDDRIDPTRFQYYASIKEWPFHSLVDMNKIKVEITGGDRSYMLKFSCVGKPLPEKHTLGAGLEKTRIIAQKTMRLNLVLHAFPQSIFHKKYITPGYYQTIEELITQMNKDLLGESVIISLGDDKKCQFAINNTQIDDIELMEGVDILLGFREQKITAKTSKGDYLPNLTRGLFAFFVYCSICQPTVVGDVNVPLLRTIHMSNKKYGITVNHIVQQPLNIPLNTQTVKNIEIEICDAYGKRVPFQNTKILMTLEFLEDK